MGTSARWNLQLDDRNWIGVHTFKSVGWQHRTVNGVDKPYVLTESSVTYELTVLDICTITTINASGVTSFGSSVLVGSAVTQTYSESTDLYGVTYASHTSSGYGYDLCGPRRHWMT